MKTMLGILMIYLSSSIVYAQESPSEVACRLLKEREPTEAAWREIIDPKFNYRAAYIKTIESQYSAIIEQFQLVDHSLVSKYLNDCALCNNDWFKQHRILLLYAPQIREMWRVMAAQFNALNNEFEASVFYEPHPTTTVGVDWPVLLFFLRADTNRGFFNAIAKLDIPPGQVRLDIPRPPDMIYSESLGYSIWSNLKDYGVKDPHVGIGVRFDLDEGCDMQCRAKARAKKEVEAIDDFRAICLKGRPSEKN
jgi:hypothetical protein